MESIIKALKANYKGIMLMVMSALLTSLGQLFWKMANLKQNIWMVLVGVMIYGMGAIIMIIAFKYGRLSILHPILCLSYVFALIFGVLILKEVITSRQIVGIILIVIGVLAVGGDEDY